MIGSHKVRVKRLRMIALGPYSGGLVFDLTGSYLPIFLAGALLVVASAALTSLARPPRPRRDQTLPGTSSSGPAN